MWRVSLLSTDERVFALFVVAVGMQPTREQFTRVEHVLPVQRGNVAIDNSTLINAILFVAVHGCARRALPNHYGRWHTAYTRMRRWAKNGSLDRVFEKLHVQNLIHVRIEAVQMDSTRVNAHPDGTGARKEGASSHLPLSRRAPHQESFGYHEPGRGSWLPPDAWASP